jgi:hypothetical protein
VWWLVPACSGGKPADGQAGIAADCAWAGSVLLLFGSCPDSTPLRGAGLFRRATAIPTNKSVTNSKEVSTRIC